MFSYLVPSAVLLVSYGRLAQAASALSFAAPAEGPLFQSSNYVGQSNNTLNDQNVVAGKSFNRFIQIWLENTDFAVAASTPTFANLAKEGLLLTNYMALTHLSQPNYVASIGGDFFGMSDDNMYHIPSNISTVIDLLEEKGISWSTYQENMPTDAFYANSYSSKNYGDPNAKDYSYYVRKHNPLEIYDSVSQNPDRAGRIRNFNDFANDAVNGTLPQWIFVTPNLINDAHDTTIDYAASFLEYWLVPLLRDERFNDERTLILVTFDENESFGIQNNVFSVVLGGALPNELKGTTDDTFYTHYSTLSTVQANWGLGSLGRQDTNKTLSNVFSFVANATGYDNLDLSDDQIPALNAYKVYPGALTSARFVPFAAPNVTAIGAGGGPVFVAPNLNQSMTLATLPPPVDLTATKKTTPWQLPSNTTSPPA